jgi:hypothetical protein
MVFMGGALRASNHQQVAALVFLPSLVELPSEIPA